MKIILDIKPSKELFNLLCEIDALIKDGSISVGVLGLSPDSARVCNNFYQLLLDVQQAKEIIITNNYNNFNLTSSLEEYDKPNNF